MLDRLRRLPERQQRLHLGQRIGPYARRWKGLEVLIPIFYLNGVSTGDFEEALVALLGNDAAQRDRAVRQSSQAVPPHRNPLRENRQSLFFHASRQQDSGLKLSTRPSSLITHAPAAPFPEYLVHRLAVANTAHTPSYHI
jgi:hypothetical protein